MGNAIIEGQGGVVEHFEDEEIDQSQALEGEVFDKDQPRKRPEPRKKPRPQKEDKPLPKKESKPAPEVVVEEEKVEEVPSIEQDLSKMTVAELRNLAKEMGLSGYSALKKAELIALIEEN